MSNVVHTTRTTYDVTDTETKAESEEETSNDALTNTSSFVLTLHDKQRELDVIKETSDLTNVNGEIVNWPTITSSPINEYDTEGLLDMTFLTFFSNGVALQMQPRLKEVKMDEYIVHLLKFHDQRFGKHPRICYF